MGSAVLELIGADPDSVRSVQRHKNDENLLDLKRMAWIYE